jgi:hypothetical protein
MDLIEPRFCLLPLRTRRSGVRTEASEAGRQTAEQRDAARRASRRGRRVNLSGRAKCERAPRLRVPFAFCGSASLVRTPRVRAEADVRFWPKGGIGESQRALSAELNRARTPTTRCSISSEPSDSHDPGRARQCTTPSSHSHLILRLFIYSAYSFFGHAPMQPLYALPQ